LADLGIGEIPLARLHDDAGGANLPHQLDHAAGDLGEPDVEVARRPQCPLAGRGRARQMLNPLHRVPPDLAIGRHLAELGGDLAIVDDADRLGHHRRNCSQQAHTHLDATQI